MEGILKVDGNKTSPESPLWKLRNVFRMADTKIPFMFLIVQLDHCSMPDLAKTLAFEDNMIEHGLQGDLLELLKTVLTFANGVEQRCANEGMSPPTLDIIW
jgi:hypothetical protein